jgi:hypothetical protein
MQASKPMEGRYMIRRIRSTTALATLAVAASLAGCGGGNNNNNNGNPDLTVVLDMTAVTPPDMTVANGPCLNGNPGCTGDPCAKASDCAKGTGPNQSAVCTKSTMLQGGGTLTWPDGYCTSPCRVSKNDPNNNGLNPDCAGGLGTCAGNSGTGTCVVFCGSSADCRDKNYACFVVSQIALGCEPAALSQCNPGKAATCPDTANCAGQNDGGVMPPCYRDTCVNEGDGTVGTCLPGCNPFTAMGCPDGNDTDCHCSDVTGEGLCNGAGVGGGAGAACGHFFTDCASGYGCLNGVCYKYCNDANAATQCSQGATCKPFSSMTKVKTSVAGICSKSA